MAVRRHGAIAQESRQTCSCPRFWLHALKSSGDWQTCSPSRVSVFRRLCGLKYGRPARSNASQKTLRIGSAVLQSFRSSPVASNWRVLPSTMRVAGKSGSSLPHSLSCHRAWQHVERQSPAIAHQIAGCSRLQGFNLRVRQCHFVPFVSLQIDSGDSNRLGSPESPVDSIGRYILCLQ